MSEDEKELDSLVEAVLSSSKYRTVSPELVRATGAKELAKGLRLKEAIKAVKSKLHQVAGAYQTPGIDFEHALATLEAAESQDAWRKACRQLMGLHASTRERLPILDSFFYTALGDIPAPQRVMDIACGLNALAISWMPLSEQSTYVAYDIYGDLMAFLQRYMTLAGMNGRAEVRDVVNNPPGEEVDLALLLKTLPCLEQLEKGVSERLLDSIRARYLLISYPVSSLGGRRKGMVATYDAQFEALATGRDWQWQRFLFDSELAFLVDNQG
jgi:16S rRNA (guanine(1405)-N(7))-methyltransferase